jgi:four helix bundle protein
VRDFRKLHVWHKAHRLVLEVNLCLETSSSRRYPGLRAQMLRAAASIPANIAEGCGKPSDAELARFSEIALGSATELDNHLLLARDAKVIDPERHAELAERTAEVRRMLFSFVRAVRARVRPA